MPDLLMWTLAPSGARVGYMNLTTERDGAILGGEAHMYIRWGDINLHGMDATDSFRCGSTSGKGWL